MKLPYRAAGWFGKLHELDWNWNTTWIDIGRNPRSTAGRSKASRPFINTDLIFSKYLFVTCLQFCQYIHSLEVRVRRIRNIYPTPKTALFVCLLVRHEIPSASWIYAYRQVHIMHNTSCNMHHGYMHHACIRVKDQDQGYVHIVHHACIQVIRIYMHHTCISASYMRPLI